VRAGECWTNIYLNKVNIVNFSEFRPHFVGFRACDPLRWEGGARTTPGEEVAMSTDIDPRVQRLAERIVAVVSASVSAGSRDRGLRLHVVPMLMDLEDLVADQFGGSVVAGDEETVTFVAEVMVDLLSGLVSRFHVVNNQ
jgi:hypothetical protein